MVALLEVVAVETEVGKKHVTYFRSKAKRTCSQTGCKEIRTKDALRDDLCVNFS